MPLAALQLVLERGGQVVVAFAGDRPGEDRAWRVAPQLPGVKRLTPAYGKDWNERLVSDGHPEQATQPDRDQHLLHSLWHWHQAARDLGKTEPYLHRITEVAREFVQGEPLSDPAQTAMQQDLQATQGKTRVRSAANAAEFVPGKYPGMREVEVSQ
jgi:hypothetical protein